MPTADFERALALLEGLKADGRLSSVIQLERRGQGLGDRHRHAQPCRRRGEAFKALASRGINIQPITTSEIKISILIDAAYTELAVRTLHSIYELETVDLRFIRATAGGASGAAPVRSRWRDADA